MSNPVPMASSGYLLIDKPVGPTSHAVLMALKRHFKQQGLSVTKIGHSGTLDPFASGMLVVALNEATKFISYLPDQPKGYRAQLMLGQATNTLDRTGEVVGVQGIPPLDEEKIRSVMRGFLGEGTQIPPMYSAKKIAGKKLYELARDGKEVERRPTPIVIHRLELKQWQTPLIEFEVETTSGTFIRTLAADLAERFGTVGYLKELRRVRIGPWTIDQAYPAAKVPLVEKGLIPVGQALSAYPLISLARELGAKILQGQPLAIEGLPADGQVVRLETAGGFIGMGEIRARQVWPKRLLEAHE